VNVDDVDDVIATLLASHDALADRLAVLEAAVFPPSPSPPFAVAWWAQTTEPGIEARKAAGYTHNVIWNIGVSVEYLDLLHAYDIKAIPFLQPWLVDHPAVVAAVVADEPDINLGGGVPKRSVEQVASTAANVRTMWPGLPVVSTIGSPCAASGSAIPDGYRSLGALPGDDTTIYAAYAAPVDIMAAQMYTVTGKPDTPKYRKPGSPDLTASTAGTRVSGFVGRGFTRFNQLCPTVEHWGLLAPCRFGPWGRDPTYDELCLELAAVRDGGGRGVLYFDISPDGTVPDLIENPVQLAAVADAIARLTLRSAER
jgi:hypothetical protein